MSQHVDVSIEKGEFLSVAVASMQVGPLERDYLAVHLKFPFMWQGRRKSQEDAHVVALDIHPSFSVVGVFDGLALSSLKLFIVRRSVISVLCVHLLVSHGGDTCANFLAENLAPALSRAVTQDSIHAFEEASLDALMLELDHRFLKNHSKEEVGATCCFAAITTKEEGVAHIVVGNVGDSRAMLIRKTGELVQLSEDHKPSNYGESMRILGANGFVKNNRLRAIHNFIGNFITAMCWKAMHKQRIIIGFCHKSSIHLIVFEQYHALSGIFVTHRHPSVGIY